MFRDRTAAGIRLAEALQGFAGTDAVVLGLPRGGVPVASVIADRLGLPLDVLLARKIGAPWNSEYAIAAVGEDGTLVCDERNLASLDVAPRYVECAAEREISEMHRRRRVFCADRKRVPIEGRTVILVDDGLATGATMEAAIAVLRARGVKDVIVAVPVGPVNTVARLTALADRVVCLETPAWFHAIGQFYLRFPQVEDAAVVKLLNKAAARSTCRA